MTITKANVKRLASLSALGVGSLAVTATAEASGIVYSGPLDEWVGFPGVVLVGPNGAGASLRRLTFRSSSGAGGTDVALFGRRAAAGTQFSVLGRFARSVPVAYVSAFPASEKWSTAPKNRILSRGIVAERRYSRGKSHELSAFNQANRYLLFQFTGGSLPETYYGWAQLRVTFNHAQQPLTEVIDWAYDTSGAPIPAGDTGTPEPSTFVMTGLAALALGATGVRSWRRSHSAAALRTISARSEA